MGRKRPVKALEQCRKGKASAREPDGGLVVWKGHRSGQNLVGVGADHFAPVRGRDRIPGLVVDRALDEPDRAVHEQR